MSEAAPAVPCFRGNSEKSRLPSRLSLCLACVHARRHTPSFHTRGSQRPAMTHNLFASQSSFASGSSSVLFQLALNVSCSAAHKHINHCSASLALKPGRRSAMCRKTMKLQIIIFFKFSIIPGCSTKKCPSMKIVKKIIICACM